MFPRVLLGLVAVVGLAALASMTALADDQEGTHEGLVVSVQGNKLIMTDKQGKNEHAHVVPTGAMITCDGKGCRLADLKKGYPIKVTIEQKGNEKVVTRIDAKKDLP